MQLSTKGLEVLILFLFCFFHAYLTRDPCVCVCMHVCVLSLCTATPDPSKLDSTLYSQNLFLEIFEPSWCFSELPCTVAQAVRYTIREVPFTDATTQPGPGGLIPVNHLLPSLSLVGLGL